MPKPWENWAFNMLPEHVPVLLAEVVKSLQLKPGQHVIDGTLGGGGHARAILERTGPDGKLLAIDLDAVALRTAREHLEEFSPRITFVHDNFANIKQIYHEQFQLHKINAILLDLGISSLELEDGERGFSFQIDAPLDMRFDKRQSLTAAEIVNTWPFDTLKKVIQEYGQERLAHKITQQIISARQAGPITKTKTLVAAILLAFKNTLGSKKEVPWIGGLHPATRTFQALRLAVNDELGNLRKALPDCLDILPPGGRLAIISFHSLEDSIVKKFFQTESRDCLCPPEVPICQCGHQARLNIITKKAIIPTASEVERNPRARSAKLRVAEKIATKQK